MSKKLERQSNEQLNVSPEDSHCSGTFDVSDAILAFRTITSMLALIPSPTMITNSEGLTDILEHRNELKVLDALSAVAVRQHEVVAAMAARCDQNIQVLVSTNTVKPVLDVPMPIKTPAVGPAREPHQCLITPNPRDPAKCPDAPIDSLTRSDDLSTLVYPVVGVPEELFSAKPIETPAASPPHQWLITPNPRDSKKNPGVPIDSLTHSNNRSTLVDPDVGVPEELSSANPAYVLDTFLRTQWLVFW